MQKNTEEHSVRLPSKGVSMKSTDIIDPVFDKEQGPDTNVVSRTVYGKVRGLSSAPIYVIIRILLDGPDTDAFVIAHSFDPLYGNKTIEQMAAREAFQCDWNYERDGSPCFDPISEDGVSEKPLPCGRFIMWDEPEEKDDCGMPSPDSNVIDSITVYDCYRPESSTRKALCRYKLMKSQPSMEDYMMMETAGDLKFL